MEYKPSFADQLDVNYISHHGIRGQQWGVRNGPPYPLSGGAYTKTEWVKLKEARKAKYSRYNKKHYDQVIKEGTELQTLARDPTRTKNADMFYASYTKNDNDRYNAIFNHKTKNTLYDKDGNPIGVGKTYKWRIKNKALSDIKVASQDSGAKAVTKLYANDRDFMNFVRDPDRLGAYLKKMYVPNGEKYRKTLRRLHNDNYTPTDKDLHTIYDMVNSVIPSKEKDVINQRTKLFKELKKRGYGAVLDINDAIGHPLASNSPVIMFDPEAYTLSSIDKTRMTDVLKSKITTFGRYALGIYDY